MYREEMNHNRDMEHRLTVGRISAARAKLAAKPRRVQARSDVDAETVVLRDMYVAKTRALELRKLEDEADDLTYVLSSGMDMLNYYDSATDVSATEAAHAPDDAGSILSYFTPGGATKAPSAERPRDADECVCAACGATGVVVNVLESIRHCTKCDATEYVIIDNERPPKRDAPKDSSTFSSKRLSHFNEWISQIQGKENTVIPDHVIAAVVGELKKQMIMNVAKVTSKQVRVILKKHKLNSWYEHIPSIIARIKGVPPKMIPPALEERLRCMFKRIQAPFVKHSPIQRKNFLSYAYAIHKMVELLGEDEYLCKFPLLKSREKLQAQDGIWKKICADLDWEFYPSV